MDTAPVTQMYPAIDDLTQKSEELFWLRVVNGITDAVKKTILPNPVRNPLLMIYTGLPEHCSPNNICDVYNHSKLETSLQTAVMEAGMIVCLFSELEMSLKSYMKRPFVDALLHCGRTCDNPALAEQVRYSGNGFLNVTLAWDS
jgi:hypothetical protein